MLSDAAAGSIFTVAWWMMLFPGLFLLATTLSFNLVGDGLRDALGPSQRAEPRVVRKEAHLDPHQRR